MATQRPGAIERFVLDPTNANVRKGLPTPMKIDNFTAQVQAVQNPPIVLNGTVPKTTVISIQQTATNAPVINETIVDDNGWVALMTGNITRNSAGLYFFGGLAGAMTTKVFSTVMVQSANRTVIVGIQDANTLFIQQNDTQTGAGADVLPLNTLLKIEVYP